MQGLAYILIISSLCFFSCSDAYTFDFATRGPGVDYTPVLEPYQQEMGTPSWSYCSREAEQFHKDFWGWFCGNRQGHSCIEVYDPANGGVSLYPGCANVIRKASCTTEQANLMNCSAELECMAQSNVKDTWNDVPATRLSCEERNPAASCTSDEKSNFCGAIPEQCRKYVDGDVSSFECYTPDRGWQSVACGEDYSCVTGGTANCQLVDKNGTQTAECACAAGYYGDGVPTEAGGIGCINEVWNVELVLTIPRSNIEMEAASVVDWETVHRNAVLGLMFADEQPRWRKQLVQHRVLPDGNNYQIKITLPFPSESAAGTVLATVQANLELTENKKTAFNTELDMDHVMNLVVKAARDQNSINPNGLDVTSVTFGIGDVCKGTTAGCWVVDFTFTTGDGFNVLYIPHAEGSDTNSFDFDYSVIPEGTPWETWGKAPSQMYIPENFPCTTADWDGSNNGNDNPGIKFTSCCIPEFKDLYRPIASFDTRSDWGLSLDKDFCDAVYCDTDCDTNPNPALPWFSEWLSYPTEQQYPMPVNFFTGKFKGLSSTHAEIVETVDPYIKQYKGRVYFDEIEMRSKAGMMEGTAGVEYVVDTFIGIAEFRPTSNVVLDTFMKQVDIHVEKTDYFQITTHGVNEYTYLQYINVRLVEVMLENNTDSLSIDGRVDYRQTFLARSSNNAAHYAQLTFTVDQGYRVMENTELIPLDSLRIGAGTFLPEVEPNMHYPCREFENPAPANKIWDQATKNAFMSRFPTNGEQSCAPDATMCQNPTSIPDQFVSFNVPLGIDWIPPPSEELDSIVFIHTVVQVEKTSQDSTPSSAVPGELIETVLSVSMPVVPGGVNIFCDSIVARTDLKSIADALIVVGSANSAAELTRLRIVGGPGQQSIADSVLDPAEPASINSSSIEAGLMTLVLLGSEDFFERPADALGTRPQSTLMGINLEDVITIHIMEQYTGYEGENLFTTPNGQKTRFAEVVDLVKQNGEANTDDQGGLNTLGYKLNGAFRFEVDRRLNTAHLSPTEELLEICGWRAVRQTDNFMSITCVLRRDIQFQQPTYVPGYDNTTLGQDEGAWDFQTAIELPTEVQARNGVLDEEMGGFMQTVLGQSDYAQNLGVAYAKVIADKYAINGQYKRAWWINPGYDWVPSQTGGRRLFQISQKLIMFALFNLDENGGIASRRSGISGRRVLLSSLPPSPSSSPSFPAPASSDDEEAEQRARRRLGAAAEGAEGALARRDLEPAGSELPASGGAGMSTTSLVYNTNLLNNLATALGVPKDQVGSWTITMQLNKDEECMTKLELEASMRKKFVEFLGGSASQIKMVQIMSSIVRTAGNVQCSAAARRAEDLLPAGALQTLRAEFTDTEAEFDTIVAFNTNEPYLDTHKFLTMPAVLDIEELLVPAIITTPGGEDDASEPAGQISPNSDSTMVILVTAFSVVSGTICTLVGMWAVRRWRKRRQEEEEYGDKDGLSAFGVGGLEGAPVAHGLTTSNLKDEILKDMQGREENENGNGYDNNHRGSVVSSQNSVKF